MAGTRVLPIALAALVALLCAGCLELGETSELPRAVEPTPVVDRISCEEIFGTAFRSEAEQAWYNENCNKWPLVKVEDPVGAPASTNANEPPECAAIRGRPYESNQQRQWYLQNCNGQPQQGQQAQNQPPQQQQANQPQQNGGGDRTDCNAIRGTTYRSNNERTWFMQNCSGSSQPQNSQANSAPVTSGPDRTDCNAIRGTVYRSDNERAWFIANC